MVNVISWLTLSVSYGPKEFTLGGAYSIFIYFYRWRVRIGDTDLNSNEDDENFVEEVRITKITKHPKYVEGVAYFDIAVLEIELIQSTGYIRPVCLPSPNDFSMDKYEGVSKIK
jgi:hypothetical protein